MTPDWNGRRPDVSHFKTFGSIAYLHIPNEKKNKLDEKGEKCVFLSVSDCSKAYKLYNPNTKKIIISRDVIFDQENFWQWHVHSVDNNIPADFDEEAQEGH